MKNDLFILLTVDVEDWFQVENLKKHISFSSWPSRVLRVEKNTHKLLDIFDSIESVGMPDTGGKKAKNKLNKNKTLHETNFNGNKAEFIAADKEQPYRFQTTKHSSSSRPKATFFVLGWIAKKVPNLVREISDRGHEVASHGYNHNLCRQQSLPQLRKELIESKILLEDIIGAKVNGFRAPSFSISDSILEIIEDCGYMYDSSLNSFRLHDRYGQLSSKFDHKKGIAIKISKEFFELPISNLNLSNPMSSRWNNRKNFILPWGGGAYFRLLPAKLFRLGVKAILKRHNAYLFYMHPWELDFQQPRVKNVSISTRIKHYSNLHSTASKLFSFIEYFQQHSFITCRRYIQINAREKLNEIRDS